MSYLPYGKQFLDDDDLNAVMTVLKSDWLTTGPVIDKFESEISKKFTVNHSISCSSGTAALHLATKALNLKKGDTAIVPTITFAATANAVRFTGADVIFADVDPENGLLTKETFLEALNRSDNVKAVLPVHLNGQLVDMAEIKEVADFYDIKVVEDACHAIGAKYSHNNIEEGHVGNCEYSDMTIFSFHPVKTITSGEGGALTTNNDDYAELACNYRNHGIIKKSDKFENIDMSSDSNGNINPWYYEIHELGFNYRVSDINCSLALSQLKKLDEFIEKRAMLVSIYDNNLNQLGDIVSNIKRFNTCVPAWHLYPVLIDFNKLKISRAELIERMFNNNIGTQVHYIPLHLQPYYKNLYGCMRLSGSEKYYAKVLSLPLYPAMTEENVLYVCKNIIDIIHSNLNG
jgi:UDP-4-amino-4,6-dideoxy-N-acetyl-beta-L-altrosamine transaminase